METSAIQAVKESMVVKLDKKLFIPCDDFNQASDLVRAYIERNGLGGSDWCSKTNGNVYDPKGKVVANISYNGRIWPV